MPKSLEIRQRQLDALYRSRQSDLSQSIRAGLRTHRPDLLGGLSDEELKRRVDSGIRRARSYGMTRLYSIAMFVELMFLVAPNFDEYPSVASALAPSEIPPDDRIDMAIFCMDEAGWQQARAMADPAAWKA